MTDTTREQCWRIFKHLVEHAPYPSNHLGIHFRGEDVEIVVLDGSDYGAIAFYSPEPLMFPDCATIEELETKCRDWLTRLDRDGGFITIKE